MPPTKPHIENAKSAIGSLDRMLGDILQSSHLRGTDPPAFVHLFDRVRVALTSLVIDVQEHQMAPTAMDMVMANAPAPPDWFEPEMPPRPEVPSKPTMDTLHALHCERTGEPGRPWVETETGSIHHFFNSQSEPDIALIAHYYGKEEADTIEQLWKEYEAAHDDLYRWGIERRLQKLAQWPAYYAVEVRAASQVTITRYLSKAGET